MACHRYVLAISGAMADGLCSLDAAGGGGCDDGRMTGEDMDDGASGGDGDRESRVWDEGGESHSRGSEEGREVDEEEDYEDEGGSGMVAPLGQVGFGWGAPAVVCRREADDAMPAVSAGGPGTEVVCLSRRRTSSTGQLSARCVHDHILSRVRQAQPTNPQPHPAHISWNSIST